MQFTKIKDALDDFFNLVLFCKDIKPRYGRTWARGYFLTVNPSCPDPGQREKINLNFCFQTSLWCLKGLYKTF